MLHCVRMIKTRTHSQEIHEFQRSEIQVLKVVSMKTVSYGMTQHSLLEMYQHFREHHCLQHQTWQTVSSTLTKEAAGSSDMSTNFQETT
jgi:hypothetical protein